MSASYTACTNRWHMSRMGFVHFWYFDHEIFPFENGKILLRGQNASGKSIATQSFITFILDGDRTPSRLDPFGSSDRKMEYYFLTENGPDDVTGYLFLEFVREETKEYKTIGIGQRAQRGKSGMGFWGFVISDGRRIGVDMELYREAGSQYIPLSKQECKSLLGEKNFFTEQQGEYMREVNRQLFGFPKTEQYRQFIQLLVKVRAPKLSKEFKPSRTYEILNDSLQTLSDEDLRAMVDAMEKMDEIESRLNSLRETYQDLTYIGREYLRYNQFLLWKKATTWQAAKKNADALLGEIKAIETELEELEEAQKEAEKRKEELSHEIRLLKDQISVWRDSDLKRAVEEKEELSRRKNILETELLQGNEKIRKARQEILSLDGELRALEGELEYQEGRMKELLDLMTEENEILLFSGHENAKKLTQEGEAQSWTENLKRQLHDLSRRMRRAKEALQEYDKSSRQLDEAEERLHACRVVLKENEEKEEAAAFELDSRKDDLIELWYRIQKENKELEIEQKLLQMICDRIRAYHGEEDRLWIEKTLHDKYTGYYKSLQKQELVAQSEMDRQADTIRKLEEELSALMEQKEDTPPRSSLCERTRQKLSSQGIAAVPFYEAVDFAPGLNEEQCGLLEQQLAMAGILDALIVPKEQFEAALDIVKDGADMLLSPERSTSGKPDEPILPDEKKGFQRLVSSGEPDSSIKEQTDEILRSITENPAGEAFVFCPDGYFRYGLAEGWVNPKECEAACYIGVETRRRRKEERIREKRAEIDAAQEVLSRLTLALEQAKERLSLLEQEYQDRPDSKELDSAFRSYLQAQETLEQARKRHEEQEKLRDQIAYETKQAQYRMMDACKGLPYERNLEAYLEAEDTLEEYQEHLDLLGSAAQAASGKRTEKNNILWNQERIQEQIDETDSGLRRKRQDLEAVQKKQDRIEELLNSPENRAMAEKMQQADQELQKKESLFHEIDKDAARRQERAENRRNVLVQKKGEAATAVTKEHYSLAYFEEELSLKLVGDMVKEGEKSLPQLAKKASELARESDRQRTEAEMVSALYGTFTRYSSSISSYGAEMEDCFEDPQMEELPRKRRVITASWQGRKMPLPEFSFLVKGSIEDTELLIQQKDRELFEKILADTLSTKLAQRISESREWIKDMSGLMQNMSTSMGLSFSLKWSPKKADAEGRLGAEELERLLRRDAQLMTAEDIGRVAEHFRTDIRIAKQEAKDREQAVNYMDMVRSALDYRRWFEFHMSFTRLGEQPRELTDRAFNRFSGGEKAMAMYVPLFSAVNAQYRKSEKKEHPRLLALDEAFAGVDERNIDSMFELVEMLDFDYIMNSQALWGCYPSVKGLRIVELLRPSNASFVTAIFYTWNGFERVLNDSL